MRRCSSDRHDTINEHYAYIAIQSAHINLGFYHGASLPDPEDLLQGSGKKLRHIKIYDAAAVNSTAISALLREAITHRDF